MINNTLQNTYNSLLKPNTKAINPLATPAQSALNAKTSSTPTVGFQGFGGGSSSGTGTSATMPVPKVAQTATKGLISPGSYKGTAITGGSDADIKAQMDKIDTPQTNVAVTQPVAPVQAAPVQTNPQPTAPTQTAPPTRNGTPAPLTYPGLVKNIADIGNNGSQGYNDAIERQNKLKNEIAQNYQDIETSGYLPLGFVQGREGAVRNRYASQLDAAQQAVNQQQTQQSTQLGALQTAAGLGAKQFQSYYNSEFDPLTGQYGTVGGGQYGSGPQAGANAQTEAEFTKKYNEGKANLGSASSIEGQIVNTLNSNPDINNQPLSLLTNINQYISGQIGSAPQQLLAQQINSYIQKLGIDPASLVDIATQQKSTLKELLKSLRTQAEADVEQYNPTKFKEGLSSGNGDTSSTASTSVANPWH